MEITEKKQGNVVIFHIAGRLDTTHYNDFETRLIKTIDSGESKIAFDLSQLDYISSSGLRVFLMGLKKINAKGGKMAMCALQDNIGNIFQIAGFNAIFQIFPDLGSGVAHCEG